MLNQVQNCITFTWKLVEHPSILITGYWAATIVGGDRVGSWQRDSNWAGLPDASVRADTLAGLYTRQYLSV